MTTQLPPSPEKPAIPSGGVASPLLHTQRIIAGTFQYVAEHDALTGLANKLTWENDIEQRIQNGERFLSVFVDLDRFKEINDRLGHDVGDGVLQGFGAFMSDKLKREGDVAAITSISGQSKGNGKNLSRWAGDEFAFTFSLDDNARRGMTEITEDGKTIKVAKTLEERAHDEISFLEACFAEFINVQPEDIKKTGLNISSGYIVYDPDSPQTSKELFQAVDKLMLANKRARKLAELHALPMRKRIAHRIGKKLVSYSGMGPSR